MLNTTSTTMLAPNTEFEQLASEEQIQRTALALEANNIHTLIAKDGAEAKRLFFELVPHGSEVFLGASKTLETLGITAEIDKSGHYDAIRPKMFAMNRETQGNEIRKLGASPDIAAGSVQAITEDGHVLIASNTASQLGPYASGAGKVIWVVGAQKIVKDLTEGFRRIEEYSLPLEDARLQQLFKVGTKLNKILIVKREFRPGRTTVILVKENLGI